MTEDTELTVKHLLDLQKRSYNNNTFEFSDFLTVAEADAFRKVSPEGVLFGGYDMAERKMLKFGDPDSFGYDVNYPVSCLRVEPVSAKFAVPHGHRDFLGSLMGLGIERRVLGDIVVINGGAYVFCEEKISSFICENLVSVGRDQVSVFVSDFPETDYGKNYEKISAQVNSGRADLIIAHVCKLSRGDAAGLFPKKLVTLNGLILEKPDKQLSEGDIFSVRGFGKFKVGETTGVSKKGKACLIIYKYL